DVAQIRKDGLKVGMVLNEAKCELIGQPACTVPYPEMISFKHVVASHATLLGAPLSRSESQNECLQAKVASLQLVKSKLPLLRTHDALVILCNSLCLPVLQHILRASACAGHQALAGFDDILRQCLSQVLNVHMDDRAWLQASLPIKAGGIGIRRTVQVAPSAFLTSWSSTKTLVESILPQRLHTVLDQGLNFSLISWKNMGGFNAPVGEDSRQQSKWDMPLVEYDKDFLINSAADSRNKARLLAVMSTHSGDWLQAAPLTAAGLRMDDAVVRVAASLRLGTSICAAHICQCGSSID